MIFFRYFFWRISWITPKLLFYLDRITLITPILEMGKVANEVLKCTKEFIFELPVIKSVSYILKSVRYLVPKVWKLAPDESKEITFLQEKR